MCWEEATVRFKNRVVVVTGATNGIGERVAERLYAEGACVVIASRSATLVEQKARALSRDRQRVLGLACDVADPESVRLMIEQAVAHFGRLDLAVNSAGITGDSGRPVAEQSIDNWNRVIATTLSGVFHCMKYEIPQLVAAGGGAIVNLSAINGLAGIAGLAPYTVAKHGVIGLTRTAALEYACDGIRVNAVAPGYVDTPRMHEFPDAVRHRFAEAHPLQRMATVDEVAAFILFLLSGDTSFCTGGIFPIDGGYLAR